ncbi:hypothetical protein B4073_0666 [Bacillus subtilis]|uniref:Uncharacterized protein n=1 Tax=Bacillus subtilis subsp. subtilis TaxID=135461 RepID=A0ABD3ZPT4_BACIU|nr:hypothetical protein B4067_0749 [Bacillus subtilis subsp. subtilis]KIN30569.1 hypothetical protein B4069_0688 [Bacillus subtilis]GAK81692.1 hypothetical protein BSMD_036120 [Bacillus subtilis Miyagi-4]KIN33945.1 hypothetical protein B4070_0749 [Bacillus subtilis]KIN35515.1 hypothetical protein B4068_0660 [Bacillus subtilis]
MTLSETWDPCVKGSFLRRKQIDRMKKQFLPSVLFSKFGIDRI